MLGNNSTSQTEVLSQEGALCPPACSPGYSCSAQLGLTCQPCAKGYFSPLGIKCKSCSCDLKSSDLEVCDKIEGACICTNLLNLCTAIPLFGNTSNLVWFVLVAAIIFALVAGRIFFQQKKFKAATAMAVDQTYAMLRLQEALKEIHDNSKTVRGSRLPSVCVYPQRVSRVQENMHKLREDKRASLSLHDGTDLDEVTTAIIHAAKTRIEQAKAFQHSEKSGEYYVDRVTGKMKKDISMSRDDEGELLSVVYPIPDAPPNIKYDENNTTDIVDPRSYCKWDDSEETSLHFTMTTCVDSRPFKSTKKKRKYKRPQND